MRKVFLPVIAATTVVVAAVLLFSRSGTVSGALKSVPGETSAKKIVRKKVDWSKVIERKARRHVATPPPVKERPPLAPDAQALVDAIDKAYDANDLKATLALAPKAVMAEEKAVREAMVWSLGWFGKPALSELILFLADSDEEIANDALRHFNDILQEFEDDEERIGTVELVMTKVTSPEILEDVAMEYLGVDDRRAVESLVRVIEHGTEAGRRQALETYESVTGERFSTPQAAQKWVEDYAK